MYELMNAKLSYIIEFWDGWPASLAKTQVRLMRFRMFRELKLMVLGLFSGLRALCISADFSTK